VVANNSSREGTGSKLYLLTFKHPNPLVSSPVIVLLSRQKSPTLDVAPASANWAPRRRKATIYSASGSQSRSCTQWRPDLAIQEMIKDQSKLHSCFGCRAFYSEIHHFGLDVEDVCQDVVKKYSSQSMQLELRPLVLKSAGGWAMGMDIGGA
jgi:hypothetical protein